MICRPIGNNGDSGEFEHVSKDNTLFRALSNIENMHVELVNCSKVTDGLRERLRGGPSRRETDNH